jgi:natural product biosynthesis luciferase-like monooxygenase protein
MEFSLFYFASDSQETTASRYRLLLEGARFADQNDFSAVWTPERHFHPFGGLYPNPSVTSAAVAAVTSKVKIRAGSVVPALHHPLRIAEEWSVVDNISNGRVGISFASGWNSIDFAFCPNRFGDRRDLMDERIEQVRSLWRGETMAVTDGSGNTQQVRVFPVPVQPELPIWITCAGTLETFRKTGRLGAGVLTYLLGQSTDELAAKIAAYRDAVEQSHPGSWPGHVTLMVHTYLSQSDDEVREVVRAPLSEYIRSSLDIRLGSQVPGARAVEVEELSADEIDFLVERAFDRYFDEVALLGSVGKAATAVSRFRDIGVDEVACLIDFGVPAPLVLSGLQYINQLRDRSMESISL